MITRTFLRIVGIAAALCCTPGLAQAATIPAGTSLSVELTENISSAQNTQGQIVFLRVSEDVTADGVVVIPRGALVEAEIGNVEGTGMVGRSGSVYFHPVRVAAADGQWVPLDPTNFGDQGEGAGVGMVLAVGLFAKGKPGFVARGTQYRVTVRRDTEVAEAVDRPNLDERVADVILSGRVQSVSRVNMTRSRSGDDIKIDLDIPEELASLAPSAAANVSIVSFSNYAPHSPARAIALERNARRGTLTATFDWWSVIRYALPGDTELVVQLPLSDGRLAQATVGMQTEWRTN